MFSKRHLICFKVRPLGPAHQRIAKKNGTFKCFVPVVVCLSSCVIHCPSYTVRFNFLITTLPIVLNFFQICYETTLILVRYDYLFSGLLHLQRLRWVLKLSKQLSIFKTLLYNRINSMHIHIEEGGFFQTSQFCYF